MTSTRGPSGESKSLPADAGRDDSDDDIDPQTQTLRILMLGDTGVGKRSLARAYGKGVHVGRDERVPMPLRPRYVAEVSVGGQRFQLDVRDGTVGFDGHVGDGSSGDENKEEEEDEVAADGVAFALPFAVLQTDVFLLCFSVASRPSFDAVSRRWIAGLDRHCPHVPRILVGTMIDQRDDNSFDDDNSVSTEEGLECARTIQATEYVECSAASLIGVSKVFEECLCAGTSLGYWRDRRARQKARRCRLM
jgi:Ras family